MASSESDFDDDFDAPRGGKRRDDDDDDFDFGESYAESEATPLRGGRGGAGSKGGDAEDAGGKSTQLQNQPYDEAVDLSDEDSLGTSVDTIDAQSPKLSRSPAAGSAAQSAKRGDSPPRRDRSPGSSKAEYGDDADDGLSRNPVPSHQSRDADSMSGSGEENDDEEEDSELDESQDATPGKTKRVAGEYNPADYAHLNVRAEVKDLWNYIGRYKPHNIELETKLKCFIPDYIPAVGEIDAFLKVPPPGAESKKEEVLGLKVLDEPASHQSDPTVLDLQLRAISKKSNLEPMVVRSLEHADKNPREIDRWISSINKLHRTKPPPQVHYSKTMPDIERLMQVWPEEFEEILKSVKLPSPNIDLSVRDYARVLCAILDIPVYQNATESLHVLFTLYSEFTSNQHFMNMTSAGAPGAAAAPVPGAAEPVAQATAANVAVFRK